jgi:hypothetical protein
MPARSRPTAARVRAARLGGRFEHPTARAAARPLRPTEARCGMARVRRAKGVNLPGNEDPVARARAVIGTFAESLRQQGQKPPERLYVASRVLLRKEPDLEHVATMALRLWSRLREIESGPGDIGRRSRAMRRLLIELGFLEPRSTKMLDDGAAWVSAVALGSTPSDALAQVASEHRRSLEATRRNVQRYFSKLGVPPPVPIPPAIDT